MLVLRGGPRDYEDRDPDPAADVVLAIKVSDSSLAFNRKRKAVLYAHHGVSDYWIMNLRERTLEVRRGPGEEGYAETRVYAEGESVPVGGEAIRVVDMLPRRSEDAAQTGG